VRHGGISVNDLKQHQHDGAAKQTTALGETLLHLAIEAVNEETGSFDCVKELLKWPCIQASINLPTIDQHQRTALMIAKSEKMIGLLVDGQANINTVDSRDHTTLMLACMRNDPQVTKALLEHGATLEAKDCYGRTALYLASSAGNVDVVMVLLLKGANMHVHDRNGFTPLMAACEHNRDGVVAQLVNYAPKKDKAALEENQKHHLRDKSNQGLTALDLQAVCCEVYSDPHPLRHLRRIGAGGFCKLNYAALYDMNVSYDELNAMLGQPQSLGKPTKEGENALHLACRSGNRMVALVLLPIVTNKGKIDTTTKKGFTALMEASLWGHAMLATALLKAGADPSIQVKKGGTFYGCTALMLSTTPTPEPSKKDEKVRDEKVVDALLKHVDERGNRVVELEFSAARHGTALTFASRTSKPSLSAMRALLSHGANVEAKIPGQGCTSLVFACSHAQVDVVEMLIQREMMDTPYRLSVPADLFNIVAKDDRIDYEGKTGIVQQVYKNGGLAHILLDDGTNLKHIPSSSLTLLAPGSGGKGDGKGPGSGGKKGSGGTGGGNGPSGGKMDRCYWLKRLASVLGVDETEVSLIDAEKVEHGVEPAPTRGMYVLSISSEAAESMLQQQVEAQQQRMQHKMMEEAKQQHQMQQQPPVETGGGGGGGGGGGVSWVEAKGMFHAELSFGGKVHSLGHYKKEEHAKKVFEDAYKVRRKCAKKVLVAQQQMQQRQQMQHPKDALRPRLALMLNVPESAVRVEVCGVNINATDKRGKTGLMRASEEGELRLVKMLCLRGADVNLRDNEGKTALMLASEEGELRPVKMLCLRGADVNLRDNEGKTALMLAAAMPFKPIYSQVLRVLCANNANITAVDKWDNTALYLAVRYVAEGNVNVLLECGANPANEPKSVIDACQENMDRMSRKRWLQKRPWFLLPQHGGTLGEEDEDEESEEDEDTTDKQCTHPLVQFVIPNNDFSCDGCSASIPKGAVMHGCRKCNYDVCEKCRATATGASSTSDRHREDEDDKEEDKDEEDEDEEDENEEDEDEEDEEDEDEDDEGEDEEEEDGAEDEEDEEDEDGEEDEEDENGEEDDDEEQHSGSTQKNSLVQRQKDEATAQRLSGWPLCIEGHQIQKLHYSCYCLSEGVSMDCEPAADTCCKDCMIAKCHLCCEGMKEAFGCWQCNVEVCLGCAKQHGMPPRKFFSATSKLALLIRKGSVESHPRGKLPCLFRDGKLEASEDSPDVKVLEQAKVKSKKMKQAKKDKQKAEQQAKNMEVKKGDRVWYNGQEGMVSLVRIDGTCRIRLDDGNCSHKHVSLSDLGCDDNSEEEEEKEKEEEEEEKKCDETTPSRDAMKKIGRAFDAVAAFAGEDGANSVGPEYYMCLFFLIGANTQVDHSSDQSRDQLVKAGKGRIQRADFVRETMWIMCPDLFKQEYGELSVNCTVTIRGLSKSPELNGMEATVMQRIPMKDVEAYEIKIKETGEQKKFKRANLERGDEEQDEQDEQDEQYEMDPFDLWDINPFNVQPEQHIYNTSTDLLDTLRKGKGDKVEGEASMAIELVEETRDRVRAMWTKEEKRATEQQEQAE
jgi:ankyrin repeat protein